MPGLSFSPFNQSPNGQPPGQAAAPVQDAIKILSFRMPSVVGGGAPAPGALLNGQSGFGSQLQGSLAQQLLQRLMSGQMGSGGGPSPAASQGLGATNPFAPPPAGGAPNLPPSIGRAAPNVVFDPGPKAPDPGTIDAPGTGEPTIGGPNPNPVTTQPMPTSPDQTQSGSVSSLPMPRDPQQDFFSRFGGGMGNRF